jgi:hypothetical protein
VGTGTNPNTITTTTGQAIVLTGVGIGAGGATFASLTTGTVGNDALSFTGVAGPGAFSGGAVTVGGTGAGGDGIEINGSGATFSFSSATVDATAGAGINLLGANGAVTFTTVDLDNTGTAGLQVTNNPNAVTVSGGTIGATNDPTGNVVDLDQGAGNVTVAANLTKSTAGRMVEVTNRSGGTVTISGSLSCTSACTGINAATNNTGGAKSLVFSNGTKTLNTGANPAVTLSSNGGTNPLAIDFTGGGLDIDTTSGAGFSATGGGTVTVQGAGNSITSTTGTALNVQSTTIGANDLTFQSISANGGSNAIVLRDTGATGNLAVSSGTITGITGADAATNGCADLGTTIPQGVGIYLKNTSGPSFTGMSFPGTFGNFGILGYGVDGFTLTNATMSGTYGNNVNQDEDTVHFCNLTGSASISGSTISNGAENNLRVINNTGTLNRLTITTSTFGLNQSNGDDSVLFEVSGSGSTMNVTITGSTFQGARGDVIQALPQAGATMNFVFGQPGAGNAVHGSHGNEAPFGGGVAITPDGTMTFDLNSNTFDGGTRGVFINAANNGAVASGYFRNNTVGISGVADSGGSQLDGPALQVESNGGGDMTIVIDNNDFFQWNGVFAGVYLQVGATAGNAVNFNATVTNNLIDQPGTNAAANVIQGFQINNGTNAGENHTACLRFSGNDVAGTGSGGTTDVRLRQRFNTLVRMPGYTGGPGDSAAIIAYIQGLNSPLPSVGIASSTSAGGGFFNTLGGAPCATPSFP